MENHVGSCTDSHAWTRVLFSDGSHEGSDGSHEGSDGSHEGSDGSHEGSGAE